MSSGVDEVDQHRLLQAHFERLIALPPSVRAQELDAIERQNPPLAVEVAALLDADSETLDEAELSVRVVHRSPEPPFELAGHQVEARIGQGGAGAVYRATRAGQSEPIALKLLSPVAGETRTTVLRFRREFRAVSRLRHPGVLPVYTEGVEGDRRFFTMQWAPHGDLHGMVGAPLTDLLAALIQVTAALDYVHSQRLVHRDLKLGNVLLLSRHPPRPVIADFGIVHDLDAIGETLTQAGGVMGSIDCISPEQVSGEPPDPRADLYALGCMMFHLWSGRPPFLGPQIARLTARLVGPAPRLDSMCSTAPDTVVELVACLLAQSPQDRPQSAQETMQRLVEILRAEDPEAVEALLAPLPRRSGGFLFRSTLVGRDAVVDQTCASLLAGESVLLAAPGGGGKTAVVTEVVTQCKIETIWRAGGAQDQMHLLHPFEALAAQIEPDLWALPADARSAADQQAYRVERLSDALARTAPAVLVLEDLHWISTPAHAFTAALLAALPPARGVAILITARLKTAATFTQLAGATLKRITLLPLTFADLAVMLQQMLGVTADGVPDGLVDRIAHVCDGNPLLARAEVTRLLDDGQLERSPERWQLHTFADRVVITELIQARLERLGPVTRQVLDAAAIIGRQFDIGQIQALLGLPLDAVFDGIDEALRAGIVQIHAGPAHLDSYAFAHDRYHEAALSSMDPSVAARLHVQRAQGLNQAAPERALAHWLKTDERDKIFRTAVRCTERSIVERSPDDTVRFAQIAVAHLDVLMGEARVQHSNALREQTADALVQVGRADEAVTVYSALSEQAQVRADRVRLLTRLGQALLRTQDPRAAVAALRRALAEAGERMPSTIAGVGLRVVWEWVRWRWRQIRHARPRPQALEAVVEAHVELSLASRCANIPHALMHAVAGIRVADSLGDPGLMVQTLAWARALAGGARLPRQARQLQDRADRLAHQHGNPAGLAQIHFARAVEALLALQVDTACTEVDAAIGLASQTGDRVLRAGFQSAAGWICLWSGRFAEARVHLAAATETTLAAGATLLWAESECGQAFTAVFMGDHSAAAGAFNRVLATSRSVFPAHEALAFETMAWGDLLRDDPARAMTNFARARAIYRANQLQAGWGQLLECGYTEALLAQLDEHGPDVAYQTPKRIRAAAKRLREHVRPFPHMQHYPALLQGIAAARDGAHAKAERVFERALRRSADRVFWLDHWVHARIALERAHMGRPDPDTLDAAEAALTTLGAHGLVEWIQRARARTPAP